MESLDITKGDYPRWIDTSTMVADPLTKAMKPDRLLNTMETGVLDLRPTPESLAIKEKNRKARQAKRELEKGVADEISSIDDGDQIAHLTQMIDKLSKQKEKLMIESTKRETTSPLSGDNKKSSTPYIERPSRPTTVPLRGQAPLRVAVKLDKQIQKRK